MLTYEIVTQASIRIIKVTGIYPNKDGCFEVEVIKNGIKQDWHTTMPIPTYKMWELLKNRKDVLSKHDIKSFIEAFNEYGQHMYSEGMSEVSF